MLHCSGVHPTHGAIQGDAAEHFNTRGLLPRQPGKPGGGIIVILQHQPAKAAFFCQFHQRQRINRSRYAVRIGMRVNVQHAGERLRR